MAPHPAVRARATGGYGRGLPQDSAVGGTCDLAMEILDPAIGAAAVHRHAVGGQRDAQDVLISRRRDARVLIELVGGVRGRPQAGAVHVAARGRTGPVADVVVAVLELLA